MKNLVLFENFLGERKKPGVYNGMVVRNGNRIDVTAAYAGKKNVVTSKSIPVKTPKEAVDKFDKFAKDEDLEVGHAVVSKGDEQVAYISWNGRVWDNEDTHNEIANWPPTAAERFEDGKGKEIYSMVVHGERRAVPGGGEVFITISLTLKQAKELSAALDKHDIYDDEDEQKGSFFEISNSSSSADNYIGWIHIDLHGMLGTVYIETPFDSEDEDAIEDTFSKFMVNLENAIKNRK